MLSKGASTPDLIVAEFRKGCRQMDLASACVLRPLNRQVLDFTVWVRGQVNEWRSGVYWTGGIGDGWEREGELRLVILMVWGS